MKTIFAMLLLLILKLTTLDMNIHIGLDFWALMFVFCYGVSNLIHDIIAFTLGMKEYIELIQMIRKNEKEIENKYYK